MDDHLFAGGEAFVCFAVVHGVEEVDAAGVVVEDLGGDVEGRAFTAFADVVDVGFDGVVRVAGGTVGVVNAEETEEFVGGVAECGEVGGFGHVTVVVYPRVGDGGVVEAEGCSDGVAGLPGAGGLEEEGVVVEGGRC